MHITVQLFLKKLLITTFPLIIIIIACGSNNSVNKYKLLQIHVYKKPFSTSMVVEIINGEQEYGRL